MPASPPRRILVLDGHPSADSFSAALARAYARGATQAGHAVTLVHLASMSFDPHLGAGYGTAPPLEPDLLELQAHMTQADHWVLAYPVWWGSVPARLKGLLDRVLLPGFAFRYTRGQSVPERLLRGRSARLLVTLDTPGWYHRWVHGAPAHRMMRDAVLGFCGLAPVRIRSHAPVLHSSPQQRQAWLAAAEALGRAGR